MTDGDRPAQSDRVRHVDVAAGPWDPGDAMRVQGWAPSEHVLLVARGVLVRDLHLDAVVASYLLGPGDIIEHRVDENAQIAHDVRFTAATDCRIAVVPYEQLMRSGRVGSRLVDAAGAQLHDVLILMAIGHMARVEDRVLALLWQLAGRWGRVTSDGVLVALDLTHEALGRLVGAQRPTVSLALKQLAEANQLQRRAAGWLLAPDSEVELKDAGRSRGGVRPARATTGLPTIEELARAGIDIAGADDDDLSAVADSS